MTDLFNKSNENQPSTTSNFDNFFSVNNTSKSRSVSRQKNKENKKLKRQLKTMQRQLKAEENDNYIKHKVSIKQETEAINTYDSETDSDDDSEKEFTAVQPKANLRTNRQK